MADLADRVCAHPFVERLDCSSLSGLIDAAIGTKQWQPGEIVCRTGTPATRCYLVERGDLAVEVHRPGREPRIIQTVNDGEVLGWSWLVEPFLWTFDVRALTPTTALALDGVALRAAMDRDHDLGYVLTRRIATIISGRLEAARLQLLDIYGSPD